MPPGTGPELTETEVNEREGSAQRLSCLAQSTMCEAQFTMCYVQCSQWAQCTFNPSSFPGRLMQGVPEEGLIHSKSG